LTEVNHSCKLSEKPQGLFKKPQIQIKPLNFRIMFKKITEFVKEAKAELKKVNWPSRQQAITYTSLVIGLSVVVALFLGGLDYIFRELILKGLIK
jgi:preprotein translocase subunit SecE